MTILIPGINAADIDALYVESMNARPELYPLYNKIFKVVGDNKGSMTAMLTPDVPLLNARASKIAPTEDTVIASGWRQTFTHQERSRKIQIPYSDASDQPSLVSDYASNLGTRTVDTIEALLCGVVANAFTTTLTARLEALCSTTHALNSGGTASNRVALALSHVNLATARAMMRFTTTDSGAVASYPMAHLLVPKELSETAYQLRTAPYVSDQLQPTSYAGQFEVSELQFTTDVNDWFIAAAMGQNSLTCVLREAPLHWNDWNKDTMTWDVYAYIRLSQGVIDWRGFLGSIT